eukprot:scaffold139166_cov21-Prasinocladus_malaysianus.AAC.1
MDNAINELIALCDAGLLYEYNRYFCHLAVHKKRGSLMDVSKPTIFIDAMTTMSVTLYGFGPSAKPNSNAPYHFYKGYQARTWETKSDLAHNFQAEWLFVSSLVKRGDVMFCHDGYSNNCGMADYDPSADPGRDMSNN